MNEHGAAKSPGRPRVFGIGLNKTGTSSLHEALTILGFDSMHWGGPSVRKQVEAAEAAGMPLLSNLDPRYDAFSDVLPLTKGYRLLDVQYPGSRFVLTVRPIDAWLDSRRRHVERNQRLREAGAYHGDFLVVEEDTWRVEWDEHLQHVRSYFGARADLLEIDLTTDPSWRPFCDLLGVPEPDVAFPWSNRDPAAH